MARRSSTTTKMLTVPLPPKGAQGRRTPLDAATEREAVALRIVEITTHREVADGGASLCRARTRATTAVRSAIVRKEKVSEGVTVTAEGRARAALNAPAATIALAKTGARVVLRGISGGVASRAIVRPRSSATRSMSSTRRKSARSSLRLRKSPQPSFRASM